MSAVDPKTYSTQLLVPQALSGSEPTRARDGSLSYDPVLGVLRIKSLGTWTDVGSGGGGTITAVVAGTGLSGGGVSGSVTLNVVYGTSSGTAAEGNDTRIVNAVQTTRTITAGTGLTGGGDLSANRTLAADFGTGAGKVTQGNDSRLSDARTPTGSAGGGLSGTYPNPSVVMTTNAPADVTVAAAAVGTGTAPARDDHKHNISTAAPSTLVVGGSNTTGSASSVSRSDHLHALPAFGTASGTFMQGNQAAGGDATGTLDSLTVTQARGLRETSGPTTLTVGSVPDLTLATRVGSTLVGRTPTSFTHKATPTVADAVLIGDAAASDAIKYATLDEVFAGTRRSGNPYIDPPTSPNAFDDEFNGGSPDLATRGWAIDNGSVTLTRSGNIDPWNASGPSAGTYWSTIYGSRIFIQMTTGSVNINITKTVSLAAGDCYWTRIGSPKHFSNPNAITGFTGIGLYKLTGGALDFNNRIFAVTFDNSGASGSGTDTQINSVTGGVTVDNTRNTQSANPGDLLGLHVDLTTATTYQGFVGSSDGGSLYFMPLTSATTRASLTVLAIQYYRVSQWDGVVPNVVAIDFVRKHTSGGWIAQT